MISPPPTIHLEHARQLIESGKKCPKNQYLSHTETIMRMKCSTESSSSYYVRKQIQIMAAISIVYFCLLAIPMVSSGGLVKPTFRINQTEASINDEENQIDHHDRIDYTNHSIIKIANRDMNLLFNTNGTDHHDGNNHEILWFDDSNPNKTYAFVRVAPKGLHRFKRDLHYLSEPPMFITSNLQSWLDAEHHNHHHHHYPRSFPPSRSLRSAAVIHPPRYQQMNPQESIMVKNNFIFPSKQFTSFTMAPDSSNNVLDDEEDEPIYPPTRETLSPELLGGNPMHFSKIVPSFVLNRYHPLAMVSRYMKQVAMMTPGVTVFTIGHTHENRPIQAIEILNNENDPNFMWIDGCTHAREWITVTTALYAIEQAILSKMPVNFIIVPILNVDGYVFTWTKDRMWRKNRRPYIASRFSSMPDRCTGVDLNRNYDINFGGTGSSKNPCSFLFQGPHPFSEPEVRAARDLLSNNRHRIKMTLSLHSFNQLWACPNAFTTERTKDHNHHMRVLKAIQQAVYATNGVMYDVGPLGSRLYLGSGFMMDWIYHKLGIRDAYLVELRDRGYFGFILPADQILPTAAETWQGIRTAIQHVFLS